MKTFRIEIAAENAGETLEDVVSFVARDESGGFGILAGREPLMTALSWGLCRFRTTAGSARYLAVPGGTLFFRDRVLRIATQRYFLGDDFEAILDQLTADMRSEAEETKAMRQMLRDLDRELLRRLAAR